jgi:putative aldouronate transport system substrate-binding protein
MYSQQANMPYQGMNFINQKWLTALRLQMPRTTEDFYNVLVAFRDRNPTGTGVATIPWVGAFMTGGNPLEFIINAFVYHPYRDHNNFYLNATDGKLWTPWTTEEYREALRYLNRLYSEGLLHASTFTNTQPELAAIVTYQPNETGRVGFFSGNMTQVLLPETPGVFDFTFQQPLTGPKNVSYYPMIPHRVVPSSFITRDCAYPEAAFRWLDYFSDKDACLISRQGEKDVDWRWLTPAELPTAKTYFGSPAIIQQINVTWATMGNKHWNIEPAQMYVEHETTVMTRWTDDGTFVANRYKMYQTYVDRVGPNRDVPEKVEDILYTAAELNQIREIRTSIDTYREESLALFITGQLSPDRDWANYLSTLDRMGLQRYLDIAQRAYTRTLEVIRK